MTRTVHADAVAFQLRFAPALITRLRGLHADGAVEVRWATTWVDDITQITRSMGLPEWACAFTLVGTGRDAAAAKYAAALDVVRTERRPLIWTDDEAIPADVTHAHRRLTSAGPPVLLIRPAPRRGHLAGTRRARRRAGPQLPAARCGPSRPVASEVPGRSRSS